MMLNDLKGTQTLALTKGRHFLFCVQGGFEAGSLTVSEGDTLQADGPVMLELKTAKDASAKYLHLKLSEF